MKKIALAAAAILALTACGATATTDGSSDASATDGATGAPVMTDGPSETAPPADGEPDTVQDETPAMAEVRNDAVAGISFAMPRPDDWDYLERTRESDPMIANLRDGFATSIEVARVEQVSIDQWLEDQKAFYDEQGYEVPEEWWTEIDVRGAARSVRLDWNSGSGDGAITTVLLEIDNVVVNVELYVYIEDLELLSADEIDAFFASLEVDRGAFRETLS